MSYVRESWPRWFSKHSEVQARKALYDETELLWEWYEDMLNSEPPYRQAARGYVAAYMPRGYFWFSSVVGRHGRLREVASTARSVLVMGSGPLPELWSLCQCLSPEATVTLVDAEMDIWEPLIREFTIPLVTDTLGLFAELPRLEYRQGTHGSITEQFDLIVAQQVLNEIAIRPVSRHRGPLTAMSTISEWRERHLSENGAIVLVDNDNKNRRLQNIENNLPRGCCERGSLPSAVVRRAREMAEWLSGPWGQCVPRPKAATKYIVVYCC